MLEKLMKKNERGFTLAELLVVVAIIAILVAVSIPIFTSKLEKSREATDVANMRAAKAAATVAMLSEDISAGHYLYDADKGTLEKDNTDIAGYGKGTTKDGEVKYEGYTNKTSYKDKIIRVTITSDEGDGTVAIAWK
ncbi:MAG: prepilin-type N-terminal cleavage/methylation domain-containing protein [Clostridiales bacterium]|nr:prepilin-type N-terminal cleavage/methylation domain-containing protein [Clostridiales bacterium]